MSQGKKRLRLVFVKELKAPQSIKHYGKVTARGEKGMFLCRNCFGYTWFETFESLHLHYEFLTISCGIFASTYVYTKRPKVGFSLISDGGFVFNGSKHDRIILYSSGVCYVVRGYSQGENVVFPIHMIGAENPKVNF